MKPQELQQLKQVTDLNFQAEQDQFRAICEEEKRLRMLLVGLGEREKQARYELVENPAMCVVGKDVAWMNWADQHRRRLTAQLANTLARKEILFTRFQVAYGKNDVLQKYIGKLQDSERTDEARRDVGQVETLIALCRS